MAVLKYFGFFFLFLMHFAGQAQYSDTTHYFVGIASTGTYNQTNISQTFLLSNTLRAGIRQKKFAFNTVNKFLYGQNGNRLVNRDFTTVWDMNYYPAKTKMYGWALATYNSVYSLKVNHQLQTGCGLAYDFIENNRIQLNISDGLLYDFSDVMLLDTIRDKYQTFRNSLRIQCRVFAGNMSFRVVSFVQNSLEYKKDVLIKADATLAYRFKKYFSITTQGNYNRMNRTGKETLFLTYGLSFEKFF